jgi:CheY-like chemotaxis protein
MDRGRYSVLILDDRDVSRDGTAHALQRAGFRTIVADSAAKALRLAEFAAAVVVQLRGAAGFDACRTLRDRRQTAALQIVHISPSSAGAPSTRQANSAGADAYLVSPVNASVLAQLLESLLLGVPSGLQQLPPDDVL